jgi:hypothetical protein
MFVTIKVNRKYKPSKAYSASYFGSQYRRGRTSMPNYEIKEIYAKRKETIERVFADAKEKHGMPWTTLRGLKKLSMQAMLTFAAMNLKKLATWTWQVSKRLERKSTFSPQPISKITKGNRESLLLIPFVDNLKGA